MKKTKANDEIPDDEMLLAKIIQNAAARGLKSCRSAPYRDWLGSPCDSDRAIMCCAIGSAALEKDTEVPMRILCFVSYGNDNQSKWGHGTDPYDGETLGYAFVQALE